MLFMLKANIAKPANVSNKEFYTVWRQESEASLGAVKAGAIKGIWKVAGRPIIIAVIDMPSADVSRNSSHSAAVSVAIPSRMAARSAAIGDSDWGWRSKASNIRSSRASRRTTSSFVGK